MNFCPLRTEVHLNRSRIRKIIETGENNMTLTNYWWLLIWLFVGGGILAYAIPKQKVNVLGQYENRWRVIPALILALPYAVWAGFREDGFGDTSAYRFMFDTAPSSFSELLTTLTGNGKDKGFTVLTTLIKITFGNSDVMFFLLIAIFQILCIAFIYRKYSTDYWLSFFLFIVSTDYMSCKEKIWSTYLYDTAIIDYSCVGLDNVANYFCYSRKGVEQTNNTVYSCNRYRNSVCRSIHPFFRQYSF